MKQVITAVLVLFLVGVTGYYVYRKARPEQICSICRRDLHGQTFYRIRVRSGDFVDVCCPRCGLRFQRERSDVVGAEVGDFETGERFAAEEAIYVENSDVHLCCSDLVREDRTGALYTVTWDRCLPSLVAFRSREAALRFRSRHGGVLKTYAELLAEDF